VLLCVLALGIGGFFVADIIVNSDWENVEEEEVVVEEVVVSYSLTTHVSPSGSGTINPSSGNYDSETQVTLTATPSLGYEFNHWSGTDDNSVNPTTVTMNSNRSITAYLSQLPPPQHTLTINVSGQGTTDPSPGSHIYTDGYQVTITPSPASGYRFDYWSGDASGTSSTITVTMNSDMNITANFVKVRYTLSTSVSPPRGGSISPVSGTYDAGTRVTLTASPAFGYRFVSWSGDASGTSLTTTITMDSDKGVTASFTRICTLTTSVSPVGGGTISPSSGSFNSGTQVTLTATPASDYYEFVYWSGDASGTSQTITITMDANKNVIANFKKRYQRIEYTMPGVPIFITRYVTYSKTLQVGDKVDGSVQLTGQYFDFDNTYEWQFQVIGPGGESIQQWKGHWVNNNYHEFSFPASYAGTYKIIVSHGSRQDKNLTIEIWPPGW